MIVSGRFRRIRGSTYSKISSRLNRKETINCYNKGGTFREEETKDVGKTESHKKRIRSNKESKDST